MFKYLYFLAAVFAFCLSIFTFPDAAANTSDKILELRNQIQELERQSAGYQNQIKQKHKEGETLKREISILENRIAKLRLDIIATTGKIDLAELEIKDLTGEIYKTGIKVKENKESISKLIRELNEMERTNLATVLLANSKISDFLNHIDRMSLIQNKLTSRLVEFIALKNELEVKKQEAEDKKNQLELLNRKRGNQKKAFEGTQVTKSDFLVKTKGQEQKFQELLNEVERKKAEFYKELQEFEAEARKQGIFIVRVKAAAIPPKGTKLFKMPMDDYIITQGYGYTSFAKRGAYGGAPHNGIDLKEGLGSEIRSIGSGTVLAKGFNNAAGNWVAIRHDNDLVSVYGHMKEPALVLAGERVNENTVLGFEGATGFVTGSHLHLSLYYEFFSFIGPKTGQIYFNYWQGSLNPFDYMQTY
ncbi:MAG: peptidoglycan DD-metalloendopeptidase family protein [Patescibacteria group bacterium]